ncbi:DUF1272 domain-containing protein [Deinococcus sp. QL22]|uniref:DUF1272 domain-containing protein n=1 Tax=Deinococcus sp. QL22 TaxID=2939437 RepID=UPI003530318E
MLEMKAECEHCQTALAAGAEALICSFECTFCAACAASMNHVCPNCSGELLTRPRRAVKGLGPVRSGPPLAR